MEKTCQYSCPDNFFIPTGFDIFRVKYGLLGFNTV